MENFRIRRLSRNIQSGGCLLSYYHPSQQNDGICWTISVPMYQKKCSFLENLCVYCLLQVFLLDLQDLSNALLSQIQQVIHGRTAKYSTFAGTLYFNKFMASGHDHIKINVGAGIFRVTEVQQNLSIHHTHTGCRNGCANGVLGE